MDKSHPPTSDNNNTGSEPNLSKQDHEMGEMLSAENLQKSEDLKEQIKATERLVMEKLESMGSDRETADQSLMTRISDLGVGWQKRREGLMSSLGNISSRLDVVEQRAYRPSIPQSIPEPSPPDTSSPEKTVTTTQDIAREASDLDLSENILVREPRIEEGKYVITVANTDTRVGKAMLVTIMVSSVHGRVLQHIEGHSIGLASDLKLKFELSGTECPACVSITTTTQARGSISLHSSAQGRKFLGFGSDVSLSDVFRVDIGYFDDVSSTDVYSAVVNEIVQRKLCSSVHEAEDANSSRHFVHYRRSGLTQGTACMHTLSRSCSVSATVSNTAGQCVFFIRHGASDVFAFSEGVQVVSTPIESADCVKIATDAGKGEDTIEYTVVVDGRTQARWRRLIHGAVFRSNEEFMDAVRNPSKYEAEDMFVLTPNL